jgi:hypothetical protein
VTDGPDDILRGLIEGDSEGPEATAEQEAFVSGLLGSLRRDDPPMPDDVLRRLDAVLAEERRTGAPALVALPGGGSDDSDGADRGSGSAPASLPDNVSVLPTAAERRGPTSRSFRILGGLAAAAVLVVGGSIVINNGSLGSSSDSSGGATAALAVVQDSNTAYSSKGFSDQAEALARKVPSAEAGSDGGSPVSAPESTEAAPPTAEATGTASTVAPSSTSDTASAEPVTPERALLCTREISAGTVTEPLLVDQGTYDGKDAEIYVLPSVDSPGQYDVYVVAAGCTTGSFELYTLQRVTRP